MGFTNVSVFHAGVQDFHKFMAVEGGLLGEVFDEDAFFGILSDVKFFLLLVTHISIILSNVQTLHNKRAVTILYQIIYFY